MTTTKKSAAKKKPTVKKEPKKQAVGATKSNTTKKKVVPKSKVVLSKKASAKKPASIKKKAAAKRKVAANSRQALLKKLREDLKATRITLKNARVAAREELTLVKGAAKAQIDVLNDNLKTALKREQALLKIGEEKVKMMLAAGRRWEKQQISKIKKLTAKKVSKK